MRVDILGQVLADGINDMQTDPTSYTRTRIFPGAPLAPSITVEPEHGFVWVHLYDGHLTVTISALVREPAETAAS